MFFRVLKIRRVNMMHDMINAFKDPTLIDASIEAVTINGHGEREKGQDLGGVFRDVLSGFWNAFFEICAGEEERVPALRHDFCKDEWEAIARIVVKGYFQVGYFPARLSKCFFIDMLFGEDLVAGELLLESFLVYLSKDERELVKLALHDSMNDEEKEEWVDFLDRFGCRCIPRAEQVKAVIIELAHKEIIQTPQYVSECWRKPCEALRRDKNFESVSSVLALYQNVKPTTKRVVDLLVANPGTNAERDAFSHLKRYVRGLDDIMLAKFLRFCTGSDVLCTSTIAVSFNLMEGAGRRVVSHTCGLILDLPCTYASFPEFREEMNCILNAGVWDIDFV